MLAFPDAVARDRLREALERLESTLEDCAAGRRQSLDEDVAGLETASEQADEAVHRAGS